MTTSLGDAADTQHLQDSVHTLRKITERAKSRLFSTTFDDDATADLTGIIDEANRKVDTLFQQCGALGVSVPIHRPNANTAELMPSGTTDRRLFLERQILDLQEACEQLQEAMHEEEDHRMEAGYARGADKKSMGSMSESAAESRMDSDSEADFSSEIMSPRGVYVQRCMPLQPDDALQERDTYLNWIRISNINIVGTVFFLFYLVSAIGYLVVRCWFSLQGLGGELWYGAIVLAAEFCSVLSLIFYGIFLCGRTDNSDTFIDDAKGGVSLRSLRRFYTIRVFVICEDESLALARRTIASVNNAYLPDDCTLKVYLLDVCKDKVKRDYFIGQKGSSNVIYIASPPLHEDQRIVNQRSEVINFALGLIYPAPDIDGFKNIPSSELVSVIDGDQTVSSNFFVDLVRYMDAGDNVGVTMAPRICYNLDPDCDIFDRQKVAYSEKVQPGMDAYGFTACSHMSALYRARALQEVDWYPEHTLAAEWELGMKLRASGWKSRVVPEYSSISEPPLEICENMESRYRDTRGHFQTFWSYSSPIIQRDLGLFFRLMYASGAFAAFASGVWGFIFTAVPIIHLISGIFPLTFNLWVIIFMTAYYVSRLLVLFHCNSLKQLRALWLARVAYALSWWINLKGAFLIPLKKLLGGASFRSRAWSDSIPSRNFKALVWPVIWVCASLVAFIGGCINLADVINLPIILSLCLTLINMVPHVLVLLYWNFGQGQLLTRICTFFMYATGLVAAFAIAMLWVLYPRDVDTTKAADMSLTFLDAQRSGVIGAGYPIDWRFTTGLQNAITLTFLNETSGVAINRTVDLSGGFYNDGEVGAVKVTWNIAMTTTMLAWSLLEYRDFWSQDEAMQNHALTLMSHGLQYIESCYQITPLTLEDGSRAGSAFDVLVYSVGSAQKERQLWRRPEDIGNEQQFIGTVYLDASPSDLAGQIVATLTSAALALRQYEGITTEDAFARVNDAHRLFRSAVFSPGLYTEALNGTYTGLEDHYPSFSFGDDLFWASTWLFRAANSGIRTYNRTYYYEAMRITMDLAYADLDVPGVSWDYVNNMAIVHASTQSRDLKFHLPAQSFIWDWICDDTVSYTRNGRAYYFQTPHLGSTAAAAAMSALYIKANQDWNFVSDNKALVQGMKCFATEQARYLLGGQVSGFIPHKPFIIGYDGSNTYTRVWHRGASCPSWPDGCDITVAYSDQPDANLIAGALLWNPIFDDNPSDARGRNTTVVSLENNMALPLLFPAVEQQGMSFSECLNTMRTAFVDRPICREGRPADYRLGPQEAVARVDPEFEGLWKPKEEPDERIPPPPPPAPRPLIGDF